MIHKPIHIKQLSLFFPHKICFEDFSAQIHYGSSIGIVGQNGSGKSSLLKIIQGTLKATEGEINLPEDVRSAYIPQVIQDFDDLSGGQRLNHALTAALSREPNVLLLDEPTNHLDKNNRKGLMKLLTSYMGTLIVVSHDVELLRYCTKTLWHIENGKIKIFSGYYDDYVQDRKNKRNQIQQELTLLSREKKETHDALMKEQHRAAQSKAKGKKSIAQRKWPSIVSDAKALRGEETSGRKKSAIFEKKHQLLEQLSMLRIPEVIVPNFSLTADNIQQGTLISIQDGSVGYTLEKTLIHDIHLAVQATDRIAITGNNGCGKSTLIKAILNDSSIIKSGTWDILKPESIGYLDQHYNTLCNEKSAIEILSESMPEWSYAEIRNHLRHFLFRKNEEVNARVFELSGGERARLSLAQMAAKMPRLLILDEITNNLDLETKQHVIEILRNYPGAMMVISHEEDFLKAIDIKEYYSISQNNFKLDMRHFKV